MHTLILLVAIALLIAVVKRQEKRRMEESWMRHIRHTYSDRGPK